MCSNHNHSHFRKRWYFLFLLVPVFIAGAVAVLMLLWNALLPVIFHVSAINFWQALGLFILARILFGGFRCGPAGRFNRHRHFNHFREKWMNMSDEEREKYKEEWKKCTHDKE